MKIGIVQFTASRDKAANRDGIAARIGDAAGQGADLIVLPEAAMHPFGRPDDPLTAVAEPLDGPFVSALCTAVANTDTTVLAGLFEAVAGDKHVFNTVVAVDRSGLRGAYRKLHLFDALGWVESDRLRAGDLTGDPATTGALLTFDVGDLRVGVLTCYDLRFPELARALVDAGATLLAVPAAWVAGPLKEDHWLTLTRARAIENTCYLAGAGQGPPQYAGRSILVDPMGVTVAQLGENDGMAFGAATAERVREVRAKMPSLDHRRYRVVPR